MPLTKKDTPYKPFPKGAFSILVYKHICLEIIKQFIMIVTGLSCFVIITQVIRLTEFIFSLGFSLENMVLPTIYVVTPILHYLTPMAFIFAVLITFMKLSQSHELVGLISTGYSPSRTYLPPLSLGFICFLLTMFLSIYSESWGMRKYGEFAFTKAQSKIDSLIKAKLQPKTFSDELFDYVFYAEEISDDRIHFKNVILAPKPNLGNNDFTVTAPRAEIHGEMSHNNLKLQLFNGSSFSTDHQQNSTVVKFEKATVDLLKLFQVSPTSFKISENSFFILPLEKLLNTISKLKKDDSPDKKQLFQAQYIYHNRVAHPFIILAFAIIAIILGSVNPRQSKNWPQFAVVLIIISTHILRFLSKMATDETMLNPILAAWMPTIFCFFIALILLQKRKSKALWESTF